MKNCIRIVFALFLLLPTAAMAAPASDASIKELMDITNMRQLIDSIPVQVGSQLDAVAQQSLQGKAANPAQQRAIDNMKKKMTALISGECSYDQMAPMFLPIYRDTFSEEEVTGIVAFYKTPAGQAVIKKMPALMQQTMQMQQEMMMKIMPKMQEIQKDFIAEMEAATKK